MKWHQIRDLFISSTKGATAASSEALLHLNEGYRELCAKLDVQELEDEIQLNYSAGDDSQPLTSQIFHIRHVDDLTNGKALEPEPAGMRGRSRFIEATTGKPPQGTPNYYVPSQGRLFLRPTADGDFVVRVRAKVHPSEITDASWGAEPTLPAQYHMTIAHAAAKSFLVSHPDVAASLNASGGEGYNAIADLRNAIEIKIKAELPLPKERERFDQRGRMYLPGFRLRRR